MPHLYTLIQWIYINGFLNTSYSKAFPQQSPLLARFGHSLRPVGPGRQLVEENARFSTALLFPRHTVGSTVDSGRRESRSAGRLVIGTFTVLRFLNTVLRPTL
jgi:hypothetical protein